MSVPASPPVLVEPATVAFGQAYLNGLLSDTRRRNG